jgi:hypothetical protein
MPCSRARGCLPSKPGGLGFCGAERESWGGQPTRCTQASMHWCRLAAVHADSAQVVTRCCRCARVGWHLTTVAFAHQGTRACPAASTAAPLTQPLRARQQYYQGVQGVRWAAPPALWYHRCQSVTCTPARKVLQAEIEGSAGAAAATRCQAVCVACRLPLLMQLWGVRAEVCHNSVGNPPISALHAEDTLAGAGRAAMAGRQQGGQRC